ncbi:Exonuclease RNase T/DNA polymerase III [Penicillium paradoxum]|uniref:Exonuclease RNase T/DNA polymerase III n=1 Tax=Penicillium paradoxum TaxID=176176 RepID=UPI002549BFAD|nr:Exonuclease RNase T/DNA polymerase III [Penicillium paradoxum]KAJ5780200.1 Exonuclease RNase T/DNA polymerase III [Penicillium paradoxum]
MATVTIAGDKLFICPGCQRGGFKSLGAVKAHFESKGHKISCIPCDRSFGNITALLKHSQKHEKPLDGPDLKSLKPAKQAQKSAKYENPEDFTELFSVEAEPVPKSKKSKKFKKSQDPTEPISLEPVEPAPTSKKSKKSQDHADPVSIKPAKPTPKNTKPEKPQDRAEVLSTKPVEPAPKAKKSKKSKDRSELLPVKSAEAVPKPVSTEISSRLPPQRPEAPRDPWDATSTPTPNANYHVTLEPLEQNLIFRYLAARCHSDTRLATRGFVLRAGLAEKNKRPSRRPPPKTGHFRQVPRSSDGLPRRRAIVLDCEMVQVEAGRRELAFLTAIDFLTGEVLIDNYVQPKSKVVNWDSRFSGVTCLAMNKAVKKGTALNGWEGARSKLWQFMDSETVLIGHSLNNDLDVLGIIHWNIVDSSIITSEAVFYTVHATESLNRTWSLKTLASELVNYDIQAGKQGHSALEDAHATRDIVIWCLRYPEHLKVWADNAREQEAVRVYERELKKATEEEAKEQKRKNEMEFKFQMISRDLPGLDIYDIGLSDDEPINTTDSSDEDVGDEDLRYERVSIEAAAASFF